MQGMLKTFEARHFRHVSQFKILEKFKVSYLLLFNIISFLIIQILKIIKLTLC